MRFAGRFFLGVRTTRVYCRPGCPARTPRRENVLFFPSAAAARAAGFRACLRCRPDAAPGSPAQAGTAATLARALRLLEERGDASGLADRLGVTDRHLRRLFARHLGASPATVLRTRRLQLARQLVETSSLSMIDVAHAAGFASLRRFNDALKRGFGRTPSSFAGGARATPPRSRCGSRSIRRWTSRRCSSFSAGARCRVSRKSRAAAGGAPWPRARWRCAAAARATSRCGCRPHWRCARCRSPRASSGCSICAPIPLPSSRISPTTRR